MKKGQIQYMETVFVLFILVIIIFIGVIVFYSFFSKSITEKGERFTDIDAVILTNSVVNMPEINCGAVSNCLDVLKIFAFDDFNDDNYYKKKFGDKRISVRLIYPPVNTGVCDKTIHYLASTEWPDNCDEFLIYGNREYENADILENSVNLYYPDLDKMALGILRIEVLKE